MRYFLIIVFILAFGAKAESTEVYKNVLYINSYHLGYVWSDSITNGIVSVFAHHPQIDLAIEYLDGKRYEDESYLDEISEIFKLKYKQKRIDLIITSDNIALDFMVKHGQNLFGNVPVVFCGINNPQDYQLGDLPYYGVMETSVDGYVLQQMLKIMPQIRNIYFISDKTQNGQLDKKRIAHEAESLPKHINKLFLDNYDVDSLLIAVSKLQEGDLVYLISMQKDKYGMPLNYGRVTGQLAGRSAVPVICNYFANIGRGVLCGCFVSGAAQGKTAAQYAVKILNEPGFAPPKLTVPSPDFYFDYPVLLRFNVDLESLPQGCKVVNKPEDAFSKYKKAIVSTLVFIVLLISIITVLSVNFRRRIKAEKLVVAQYQEIQQQNEEIKQTNYQLNNANEQLEITNGQLAESNAQLRIEKSRAEKADKLKNQFLQNISHEIRTPLNAITGFIALINKGITNISKEKAYIDLIYKNSFQLMDLMQNLIVISEIQAGTFMMNKEKFDIKSLIELLPEIYAEQIELFSDKSPEELPLIIKVDQSCENCFLVNDLSKLKQIFSLLFNNAIKYTSKGYIEVGVSVREQKVEFYVKDTGIGIKQELINEIFDLFRKIEPNEQCLYRGTGLGLSIVKELLAEMQGEIRLKSVVNEGTSFYFGFL
jgi:two-component system, sensor histidine kinase